MAAIKQKEYLKKYLSIGKDKSDRKKKKKSKSNNVARLTIIDDNADTFENAVKEDLLEDEDAPQIVAVIDDRPPSLQIDEKSKSNLWIPIGSNNDDSTELYMKSEHTEDLSPPRSKIKFKTKKTEATISSSSKNNCPDKEIKIEKDISPPRNRNEFTPPRTVDAVQVKVETVDSDVSPPRQRSLKEVTVDSEKHYKKYNDDDDFSPPRPRKKSLTSEMPRKKRSRWENENVHESPPSHHHKQKEKHDKRIERDDDISPLRKRNKSTPPKIMKTTLDGKTAGLQNAKQLAAESIILKEKEMELFNKMSSEISGANAATIIRDRKTGRVRNLEEEAARQEEKKKKEHVNKEKYSRWGRGLKQCEDQTKKREEALNEMSKPLARYADDEDLERYLKEQEREGDPMLAYLRKKKKKKDVEEGKPMKPEYMGEFMPNRFGIRPGHRWDGVDRSNGYEKKWFEIQNSKMAQQEEAYRWGIEDM